VQESKNHIYTSNSLNYSYSLYNRHIIINATVKFTILSQPLYSILPLIRERLAPSQWRGICSSPTHSQCLDAFTFLDVLSFAPHLLSSSLSLIWSAEAEESTSVLVEPRFGWFILELLSTLFPQFCTAGTTKAGILRSNRSKSESSNR